MLALEAFGTIAPRSTCRGQEPKTVSRQGCAAERDIMPTVRVLAPRGAVAASAVARPLFAMSRRPPPAPAGMVGAGTAALPRLAGIVILANYRRAIFERAGAAPLSVGEDDMVGGLASLNDRRHFREPAYRPDAPAPYTELRCGRSPSTIAARPLDYAESLGYFAGQVVQRAVSAMTERLLPLAWLVLAIGLALTVHAAPTPLALSHGHGKPCKMCH